MIDCNITTNYFAEKRRMTKKPKRKVCQLDCNDCPLYAKNNGTDDSCESFEMHYPEKAIAAVQKWSDQHPQKTYLTELLEKYPNVLLNDNGLPKGICPHQLGMKDSIADCKMGNDCVKCWNQPIPIEDGEE